MPIDDKVNLLTYIRDLQGVFQTVSVAPTGKPKRLIDQIVVYKNSTVYRLYWYDTLNDEWHYILATA